MPRRARAVYDCIKDGPFIVTTNTEELSARLVLVSTGVRDNLPGIEGVRRHLGRSFFTCIDCDGYRTTGKETLVIGNSMATVRLAMGMKEMFTPRIKLLLVMYTPPEDVCELLGEEGIELYRGRPGRLLGEETIEGVQMGDGTTIVCECVMSNFGFKLNDEFLDSLDLKRDAKGFKYIVNSHFESSVQGLFIVGPLNTGPDQIVVAAGQGATAAIEMKKRLLEI